MKVLTISIQIYQRQKYILLSITSRHMTQTQKRVQSQCIGKVMEWASESKTTTSAD